MSFSSEVKKELYNIFNDNFKGNLIELLSIFYYCGKVVKIKNNSHIFFKTDNFFLAKKIIDLVSLNFKFFFFGVKNNMKPYKGKCYIITLFNNIETNFFIYSLNNIKLLNEIECFRRAYIRGAFISSGSIANPFKTYHVEFLVPNEVLGLLLLNLINSFNLNSKIISRKNNFIVYLKEGEAIVDILNIMGAHIALMEFENIRIIKEVRNSVNRKVNCETANLTKTINASLKQINDINYIKSQKGLDFLQYKLKVVAEKRLELPNDSLKEIGLKLNPPVGKSGVNHRLRKITKIANKLKENNNDPS